jgi:uncharacterized protein (DUF697 family)
MAEEATTYQEKSQRLSVLRQELAALERDLKRARQSSLEQRKEATSNPKCEAIINRYVIMAAVAGLLPTFLDAAALMGLQIKMIDDLAEQFGKNYTEQQGKNTLEAITGGMVAPIVAPPIASAAVVVPVVGPLVSFVTSPAASAISTRVIGHLALERFEREEAAAASETAKAPGKEPEAAAPSN